MTVTKAANARSIGADGNVGQLLKQYGAGGVAFSEKDNELYERHLLFEKDRKSVV